MWAVIATAVLGDAGDLAGFRELEPFWPLTLGTLVLCTAWALLVGRGPLEWVLDPRRASLCPTDPAARLTVRNRPIRTPGASRNSRLALAVPLRLSCDRAVARRSTCRKLQRSRTAAEPRRPTTQRRIARCHVGRLVR